MEDFENERLIDKRTLLRLVPLSYSTVWKLMRRGEFPLSVRVDTDSSTGTSNSRVFWHLREVQAWIASRPRSEYAGFDTACEWSAGTEQ